MRMWMVDPSLLCRQHLLAEHNECHSIAGSLRTEKGQHHIEALAIQGFIELPFLADRHAIVAAEMLKRGYRHESPLDQPDQPDWWNDGCKVLEEESIFDLITKCDRCETRINNAKSN